MDMKEYDDLDENAQSISAKGFYGFVSRWLEIQMTVGSTLRK